MDALSLSCCSSGQFSVHFFCVLAGGGDGRHKSFFGETDARSSFFRLFVSTRRDCRHFMMQDVALREGGEIRPVLQWLNAVAC